MKKLLLLVFALSLFTAQAANRPNLLFITVDDMSADSIGAFGCKLAGTTPQIDKLASESLRFQYAHVVVGNCMPSRNVMLSGRYPHNNRVEGFYQVKDKNYPVLSDLMKEAGYFTAIRGKVSHSTPYHPYEWDLVLDDAAGSREHPKDVASYGRSTSRGIAAAKKAGKPFCLLVNISDPHKPFYATGKKGEKIHDPHKPSRVFTADEVPIPGFLFDHPDVRTELAQYYSTVRRADDCAGEVLKALRESGAADDTVIFFLSDHGMPLPFAKTAVWHHSTHTPLIVKWPGVTKAGSVDRQHMVSAVDLLPTFLDVTGTKHPNGMDGRSFAPLIHGKKQADRDFIFKEYNENSGAGRHPMRSIQSRRFCYIYSPWSDGKNKFKTATTGTMSYRAMQRVASTDKNIAARLKLFDHGAPEEFYDVEKDPDCLHNLINDPTVAKELARHRKALADWMKSTGDHLEAVYADRNDDELRAEYMVRVQNEANERRKAKLKSKPKRQRAGRKLIKIELPDQVRAGKMLKVKIPHEFPKRLGEQKVHVTLKVGKGLNRLQREIKSASGKGILEFEFKLPSEIADNTIGVAAFVGEDYQRNLQHLATKAIKLVE